MAPNKAKFVENAQKFLHQGKVSQAIAEYQQILRQEPKDQVTLMTIGDLYVRQGETFQALEFFERLAQIFLADGFTSKAIAIYKKIAKLAPEETRPVERLAELYVQQGVLSEARPIYLQLAELHLRAGRQQQSAALLRKLLDAEPDNLRVQTRLAELSLAMNQPEEAAAAFRTAAEHLLRRGDHAEAISYADRALLADPTDVPTLLLKARAQTASGQPSQAIALLEATPHLDSGGEAAQQLLSLYLETGNVKLASELAARIFSKDSKKYASAHQIAVTLLESGDPQKALALLDLIREKMTDAGEHEALSQSLIQAAESLPGSIEPREWLVELYGRTSDSFRLPDALVGLAETYEGAGQREQAKKTYEKLLDRDPENESVRRKYDRLCGRAVDAESTVLPGILDESDDTEPAAGVFVPDETEPGIDEDTHRFIMQALTDVDLFSSYGLTQKAIDLLESVVRQAPQHTVSLERLLDIYLGAGDERRTAELASRLREIHASRGNTAAADRFAELSKRFERAASTAETAAAHAQEFSVPMAENVASNGSESVEAPVTVSSASRSANWLEGGASTQESVVHEVDLSEDWAAIARQFAQEVSGSDSHERVESPAEPFPSFTSLTSLDPPMAAGQDLLEGEDDPFDSAVLDLAPDTVLDAPSAERVLHTEEPSSQPEPAVMGSLDDSLAGIAAPAAPRAHSASEGFFDSLAPDLDEILPTMTASSPVQERHGNEAKSPALAENGHAGSHDSTSPLSEVFEEFRAELGELGAEEEDLETHYNLGIAYREMGLLEEAISEFQKVAKGNKNGSVFRYAMQCCTLLGLAFTEKGQPGIAAMWYERALLTPGLDQESVLALRYDLGVSQEQAGEISAARKSFSQVYGMNIDYRDVAERLASLGKGQ